MRLRLTSLAADITGSMAIETAIIAPVLLMLSLGGVEAGTIIARQSELQSAASDALNIVQASPPGNAAQRTAIRDILMLHTGIEDEDDATVEEIYRCGTDANFVDSLDDCDGGPVSTFIQITLVDSHEPRWTMLGLGSDIDYNVVRTVQVS